MPDPLPGLHSCLSAPRQGPSSPLTPPGWRSKGCWRDSWHNPAPCRQGGTGQGYGMGTPCTQNKAHGLQSGQWGDLAGRGRNKHRGCSTGRGGGPLHSPVRSPSGNPQTPRNWNGSRGPLSRMMGAASPHKAPPASPRAPGCCSLTPCAGRLETANELGPFPASRSRVAPAGVGHRSPRDGRDSVVWIAGNGR